MVSLVVVINQPSVIVCALGLILLRVPLGLWYFFLFLHSRNFALILVQCECENQAKITCWAQRGGGCQSGVKVSSPNCSRIFLDVLTLICLEGMSSQPRGQLWRFCGIQ